MLSSTDPEQSVVTSQGVVNRFNTQFTQLQHFVMYLNVTGAKILLVMARSHDRGLIALWTALASSDVEVCVNQPLSFQTL